MMRKSNALGVRLRQERERRGWSIAEAERQSLGAITSPHLCKLETGKLREPRLRTCMALAALYGLPLDTLADWMDEAMPRPERQSPSLKLWRCVLGAEDTGWHDSPRAARLAAVARGWGSVDSEEPSRVNGKRPSRVTEPAMILDAMVKLETR